LVILTYDIACVIPTEHVVFAAVWGINSSHREHILTLYRAWLQLWLLVVRWLFGFGLWNGTAIMQDSASTSFFGLCGLRAWYLELWDWPQLLESNSAWPRRLNLALVLLWWSRLSSRCKL
jgi:hypothetical protein